VKFPATREELKAAGLVFVYARPCKRCDRNLEFYRTPAGLWLALESTVVGKNWVMDLHQKTCPYADEFSKKPKRGQDTQGDLFEKKPKK
jgi:hypothetical protein